MIVFQAVIRELYLLVIAERKLRPSLATRATVTKDIETTIIALTR
jgi:hypothetical protein